MMKMRIGSMTMGLLLAAACTNDAEVAAKDDNMTNAKPSDPAPAPPNPARPPASANATATELSVWFIVETHAPGQPGGLPAIRVANGRPETNPVTGKRNDGLYLGDDAFRWVSFIGNGVDGPMATDPNWETLELGENYVLFDPAKKTFEKHGSARDLVWKITALDSVDDDGQPELLLTYPGAADGTGKNFTHALVLTNGRPLDVEITPGIGGRRTGFFGFDPVVENPKSDGLLGIALKVNPPHDCATAVHHYRYVDAKSSFVIDRTDCQP